MEFGELIKGAESEGKEKHVPYIEVGKGGEKRDVDVVQVLVGKEVPHPNTTEHHIAWIELYGIKNDGRVICIGRVTFGAGYSNPNAIFQVPVTEFNAFCALSYCNIHGLWQNCIVNVIGG